jgi:methionyl-tRNA formyltransferase
VKVLIVTQTAPLYLGWFIHDLVQNLQETKDVELQGVVAFSPIFKKSTFEEAKARLALYGPWNFLKLMGAILAGKVLSPFIAPHKTFSRLEPVLKHHGLPLFRYARPNDVALLKQLEEADLMVSIACPKILSKEIFQLPTQGSINYHTGALPRYRGRQPLYWAMLNGEKEVGITVHRMAEEVDAGPILHQKMVDIQGIKSLHEVYLKTLPKGVEVLTQTIKDLSHDCPQESPNDIHQHTPNSFPEKKEGQRFRSLGLRII